MFVLLCFSMIFAPLAQTVEHLTFNQGVRSSSLRRSTNKKPPPLWRGLFAWLLPESRRSGNAAAEWEAALRSSYIPKGCERVSRQRKLAAAPQERVRTCRPCGGGFLLGSCFAAVRFSGFALFSAPLEISAEILTNASVCGIIIRSINLRG